MLDQRGSALSGYLIDLLGAGGIDDPIDFSITGEDGSYDLLATDAGAYTVQILNETGDPLLLPPPAVQLGSDIKNCPVQMNLTVSLPCLQIEGTVTNPDGGAVSNVFVTLSDASGSEVVATATEADGTFMLEGQTPGLYSLMVLNDDDTPALDQPYEVVLDTSGICPRQVDLTIECPICEPSVNVGDQKQYQGAWASNQLDCNSLPPGTKCTSPTYAKKGCLVTCLANVSGKTPTEVNAALGPQIDQVGTIVPFLSDALAKTPALGFVGAEKISLDRTDIMSCGLCRGNPVLVRVIPPNGPEHWVAIIGQTEGPSGACDDFSISDPGYSKTKLSDYATKITGVFVLVKKGGGGKCP